MSLIADTLRNCAYSLPIKEGSLNALFGGYANNNSPFICDHLSYMPAGIAATLFLQELGMGCGLGVFMLDENKEWGTSDFVYTRKHQLLRAWWLFFAADLAEEWGML